MEQVELSRYQAGPRIGSGADYEVRTAVDLETGTEVVLKRPVPQMIKLNQHQATEARTNRVLQVHGDLGGALPGMVPVLGYTERELHDGFFGDSLGVEYRVTVEERAKGIPLLGDHMARITGVPVGVGQQLFALHPLLQPPLYPQLHPEKDATAAEAFPVQQQLIDLQHGFLEAGYLLLDMRPQNIFYQPASGQITIIDCGALAPLDAPGLAGQTPGGPPLGLHALCLEVLKFYVTTDSPPQDSAGYRDSYGLRPVVNVDQELEDMEQAFAACSDPDCRQSSLHLVSKINERAYSGMEEFRTDLNAFFQAAVRRNESLPIARQAWLEALEWLKAPIGAASSSTPSPNSLLFSSPDLFSSPGRPVGN